MLEQLEVQGSLGGGRAKGQQAMELERELPCTVWGGFMMLTNNYREFLS